jgi:DNA repair exonuclease SbcCD ATPase subunit
MENSIINYDHENFSDSNEEKIFNLQLLVTKLEEEISYYRNGTSAEQFMEIIHERDNEIKDLKHEIYILNEEKVIQSEKLKEIVLKSSEVLEKYESLLLKTDESDVLHDENNRLKRQVDEALTINEDLQEDLSRMKKQMIENAVVNASLQDEISRLKRQIVENSSSNTALRDENHRLKAEIDGNSALHKSMIAENKSLRQLNDDNMITITNHQNEIQKLNNLIEELQHNTVLQHDYDHLIIELNSLRSQQEDSEHYHHEIQERDSNIEKLQQRCACLVSEKSELKKLFEKEKSDRIKQGKEFRVIIQSIPFFLKMIEINVFFPFLRMKLKKQLNLIMKLK